MNVLLKNKDALLGVSQMLVDNYEANKIEKNKRLLVAPPPAPYNFMQMLENKFNLERGAGANERVKVLIERATNTTTLENMHPEWAPFI